MFFAPNTDHPEVREAYRAGVEMLLKECPLIKTFSFHTNDAGAFMPWAKRNFLLPNGPTGTLGRDMGERVVGWLSALRQGALDAGTDAWFFIDCRYWFNDDEAHSLLKSLKPGIGIHGMALGEQAADHSLIGCGAWNGGYFTEIIVPEYPTPMSVMEGVRAIKTSAARRLTTGGMTTDFFPVFKAAMAMPAATTEKLKMDVLRKMAETRYAADVVDDAVDAWYLLEKAETMMSVSAVNPRNHIAMLRWVVRPLVPHQEWLTDDEKNYWLPYIYQSRDSQPDAWMDYLNHSGYKIVNNWEEAGRVCCAIDVIEATLLQAAEKLRAAADKTKNQRAKEKLTADSYRVRAMRCLTLTIRHTLQMGTLIYLRDARLRNGGVGVSPAQSWVGSASVPLVSADAKMFDAQPGRSRYQIGGRTGGTPMPPILSSTDPEDYPNLPKGNYGDNGLFFMNRTMRWELDNINATGRSGCRKTTCPQSPRQQFGCGGASAERRTDPEE
jgi:hypothetical protein